MPELTLTFAISSFVAGLLTFLAPCTLPLVPAYLGFISDVDTKELENPSTAPAARRRIFLNGLFFIIGFSLIFIIFGTLAGLVGQTLAPFRIWLTRIGGAFVILFGLFMLGLFNNLSIFKAGGNLKAPRWLQMGKPSSSFIVGGAFAFGWTPCVGPILGSILLLASTSTTALQGALLLALFSVGLAIPFLLLSLAFSKATKYIKKITAWLRPVSIIGGIFLILLGFLLITNQFGLTIEYGYRFFDFLEYDRLLEFL